MLFSKLFALSAMTTLAAATAITKRGGGGGGGDSGSSGSCPAVQCCKTVTKASDPAAAGIIGLLGIVINDLNVGVGLNCSPITIIGGGNGACSSTTVYCEDNSHGNLISLGCLPITI
ncbi:hypothetical protein V5O48_002489 [Marasmius crinis-equi]|uniref:Hydrophobin n=1 Tax=Marasmius crinis-equi TaxID=585013 RepID=A0ABR3FVJ7_9AGAR